MTLCKILSLPPSQILPSSDSSPCLREENDIDESITMNNSLYNEVRGLEKQDLMTSIKYYEQSGMDTTALRKRLNEVSLAFTSRDLTNETSSYAEAKELPFALSSSYLLPTSSSGALTGGYFQQLLSGAGEGEPNCSHRSYCRGGGGGEGHCGQAYTPGHFSLVRISCLLLADPGVAKGCSTNITGIDSFIDPLTLFFPTALRRRQA